MTIYILGSSSTAMRSGWADSFAIMAVRKYAVRNLALGAANSFMSMIELATYAPLTEGDIVIWSNATSDVVCLANGHYQDGGNLQSAERIIRRCADAGARFVPVVIDRQNLLLEQQYSEFKDDIQRLMAHYGLPLIDLTAEFRRESQFSAIPRQYFDLTGHLKRGSEVTEFLAELVWDYIEQGLGTVAPDRAPALFDPDQQLVMQSEFGERGDTFRNSLRDAQVWEPGFEAVVPATAGANAELLGIVLLADPEGGAIDIVGPRDEIRVSAAYRFNYNYTSRPVSLPVYLPNHRKTAFRVKAGEQVSVHWATGAEGMVADSFFCAPERLSSLGPSRSRIQTLIYRARVGVSL